MMEIKIANIGIEDISMGMNEKIDHLLNKKGYSYEILIELVENYMSEEKFSLWRNETQSIIRYYEEHHQELVELFEKNPESLTGEQFPNQIVYIIVVNKTPFDFKENYLEISIESVVFDILRLQGKMVDFKYAERISSRREKHYIELEVSEDEQKENKIKCKNFSEISLLKEFGGQTVYGKVVSFPIQHEVLDVFLKNSDFYVITSTLNNASGYLCSSDLGQDIEDFLLEREYISLPQIMFSDYVNEVINIIHSPLFPKICDPEHVQKIQDWLGNVRKDTYTSILEEIEHILGNMAGLLGFPGKGMENYLNYLTSNTNRRLFEETRSLIKALGRNPLYHGTAKRPKWDEKYLTILSMKAIRDIYCDWLFFESLTLCLENLAQKEGRTVEKLWPDYYDAIKLGKHSIDYEIGVDIVTFRIDNSNFSVDPAKNTVKEVVA